MNFRWICKDIWDIECEHILCWINERVTYILLHISTIYHALHSIMELKKTILFWWNTKFHPYIRVCCTSRSKFICFPYSIYPYRSSTIWIWKFARTVSTTVTSAVFIKLTCRFVILMFCSCSSWPSWSAYARVAKYLELSCKQKGVLEEKGNTYIRTVAMS